MFTGFLSLYRKNYEIPGDSTHEPGLNRPFCYFRINRIVAVKRRLNSAFLTTFSDSVLLAFTREVQLCVC